MTYGEQVKAAREQKNLSQEELAERIGISRQALSKWENNLSVPRGVNREFLHKVLEWELDPEDEKDCNKQGTETFKRSMKERLFPWSGWVATIICLVFLITVAKQSEAGKERTESPSRPLYDSRNVSLAGTVIEEGLYKDYTITLQLIKGWYYKSGETEPGGGVYEENYEGEYVLFLKDQDGKITDELSLNLEWAQDDIVFPGNFTFCINDYNRDGAADFTIGIYDSSYMNRYWLFSVDEERKIANIGPEEVFVCWSKDSSVMLLTEEGSIDAGLPVWDVTTGKEEIVYLRWNKESGRYE